MPKKRSSGELAFLNICKAAKLDPMPETEYRFHPTRRWRFDFAWPDDKVAVEIEGGVWTRGRHTRPTGYMGDLEKYNEAVKLGWKVLRYTPSMLSSNVIDDITRASKL